MEKHISILSILGSIVSICIIFPDLFMSMVVKFWQTNLLYQQDN